MGNRFKGTAVKSYNTKSIKASSHANGKLLNKIYKVAIK